LVLSTFYFYLLVLGFYGSLPALALSDDSSSSAASASFSSSSDVIPFDFEPLLAAFFAF